MSRSFSSLRQKCPPLSLALRTPHPFTAGEPHGTRVWAGARPMPGVYCPGKALSKPCPTPSNHLRPRSPASTPQHVSLPVGACFLQAAVGSRSLHSPSPSAQRKGPSGSDPLSPQPATVITLLYPTHSDTTRRGKACRAQTPLSSQSHVESCPQPPSYQLGPSSERRGG